MKKYNYLILIIIVLVAVFFRIYKIQEYFNFSGELGDNLLDIKNIWNGTRSTLIGPPTSHPWLYFGPLYYWLLLPVELIFAFSPLGAGFLGTLVGTIIVLVNYLIISKIYNQKIALISSFLMSFSPLWVDFSRDSRFYFLITLLFYPLLCLMTKKEKINMFLVGIIVGLMLNLHYSAVIFIPVILILKKDIKRFISGIVIPLTPLIIYDGLRGFSMTKNILIWFPYRVAGFFGLYPKNNFSLASFQGSLNSIVKLFGNTLTEQTLLWPLLIVVSLFVIIFHLRNRFIVITLIMAIVAVVIHGDSPLHYLLPIFPIPLILYSLFIEKLAVNNIGKIMAILLLVTFMTSNSWIRFRLPEITYDRQIKAAQEIIRQAGGKKFSLVRVGPNDQFEENYSQNYHYLLWYSGNEPVEGQNLKFTIIENNRDILIIKS